MSNKAKFEDMVGLPGTTLTKTQLRKRLDEMGVSYVGSENKKEQLAQIYDKSIQDLSKRIKIKDTILQDLNLSENDIIIPVNLLNQVNKPLNQSSSNSYLNPFFQNNKNTNTNQGNSSQYFQNYTTNPKNSSFTQSNYNPFNPQNTAPSSNPFLDSSFPQQKFNPNMNTKTYQEDSSPFVQNATGTTQNPFAMNNKNRNQPTPFGDKNGLELMGMQETNPPPITKKTNPNANQGRSQGMSQMNQSNISDNQTPAGYSSNNNFNQRINDSTMNQRNNSTSFPVPKTNFQDDNQMRDNQNPFKSKPKMKVDHSANFFNNSNRNNMNDADNAEMIPVNNQNTNVPAENYQSNIIKKRNFILRKRCRN